MNEDSPTPEDIFKSEFNTLNTYYRKLSEASSFLDTNFNGMEQNIRFNRYKEYLSEIDNTQKQIEEQRPRVITAYHAMISHNHQ
jgi:hypothetical protein